MLGASSGGFLTSSSAADASDLGSGGVIEVGASSGGVMEDIERISGGGGGNRWPKEETLALLKIRSDMDAAFRDSSLKGPLWEEVSRKMAELGFQRSAKKCKEKFENVYKYHKRTKGGRASKSDGKSYRFFDQLEALDHARPPAGAHPPPQPQPPPPPMATSVSMALPIHSSPNFQTLHPPQQSAAMEPPLIPTQTHTFQPEKLLWDSTSSSSTSSDEDIQRRRGKKRKWKDFFHRLMRDVIQKQEELQKKFLETLEKRERDQMAREEAWRVQEMARMNKEHEILEQERSTAAAKDAAVISFLKKISDQHNLQIPISTAPPMPPPPPSQLSPPPPPHFTILPPIAAPPLSTLTPASAGGGDNSIGGASSSRWPKSEVQALIQLRMNMEVKYQETGPKGPLWEEISAGMAKLGYRRSGRRCKEKWENINKYFKKVKESNKKRPEDSKTCPYYHLLDAIYKEKAKSVVNVEIPGFSLGHTMRLPENPTAPIMALPEQQWPQDHSTMPPDPDQDDNESEEDDEDNDVDDGDGGDCYEQTAAGD